MNRRQFFITAGAAIGWVVMSDRDRLILAQPKFSAYPFSLGVASGDPQSDSVVLWTRLAPDPLGSPSMPKVSIPLTWKIATDAQMTKIVQKGTTLATPEWGHAVHVVVEKLLPGQWYWYQFQVGQEKSPMGRTRTLPAPGARLDQLKFAFVSCQNYEYGYYTAYEHLAQENVDMVFHLGDYIYEGDPRPGRPRQHVGSNPVDLATYRLRYALYKSDPHYKLPMLLSPLFVFGMITKLTMTMPKISPKTLLILWFFCDDGKRPIKPTMNICPCGQRLGPRG